MPGLLGVAMFLELRARTAASSSPLPHTCGYCARPSLMNSGGGGVESVERQGTGGPFDGRGPRVWCIWAPPIPSDPHRLPIPPSRIYQSLYVYALVYYNTHTYEPQRSCVLSSQTNRLPMYHVSSLVYYSPIQIDLYLFLVTRWRDNVCDTPLFICSSVYVPLLYIHVLLSVYVWIFNNTPKFLTLAHAAILCVLVKKRQRERENERARPCRIIN